MHDEWEKEMARERVERGTSVIDLTGGPDSEDDKVAEAPGSSRESAVYLEELPDEVTALGEVHVILLPLVI